LQIFLLMAVTRLEEEVDRYISTCAFTVFFNVNITTLTLEKHPQRQPQSLSPKYSSIHQSVKLPLRWQLSP
jgi:hypothetical protein